MGEGEGPASAGGDAERSSAALVGDRGTGDPFVSLFGRVTGLPAHVAEAVRRVVYESTNINGGVQQQLREVGFVYDWYPGFEGTLRGVPLTMSTEYLTEAELGRDDRNLSVRKFESVPGPRSRDEWGGINALTLAASRGVCSLGTGFAGIGASLLLAAAGTRPSKPPVGVDPGRIRLHASPFARSWTGQHSLTIWGSEDIQRSTQFHADLGPLDWNIPKMLAMAVAMGWGRPGVGLDLNVYRTVHFYGAAMDFGEAAGLDLGGVWNEGRLDPDAAFRFDDAWVQPAIDHAASEDVLEVTRLADLARRLLVRLGENPSAAVDRETVLRWVAILRGLVDVDLFPQDLLDEEEDEEGEGEEAGPNPAWVTARRDLGAPPGAFGMVADQLDQAAGLMAAWVDLDLDGDLFAGGMRDPIDAAANVFRWWATRFQGTGAVTQALVLAAACGMGGEGPVRVSPFYTTQSVRPMAAPVAPLMYWGVQQEVFLLNKPGEPVPLVPTGQDARAMLRALGAVLALATDARMGALGYSAELATVGTVRAHDLTAHDVCRSLSSAYLDAINGMVPESGAGGMGWMLQHPHTKTAYLAATGWEEYTDLVPNAWPLPEAGMLRYGLSASRLPVWLWSYVFRMDHPFNREMPTLGNAVHRVGQNTPAYPLVEWLSGVEFGNERPLFYTMGMSLDEPRLGQASLHVGLEGVSFSDQLTDQNCVTLILWQDGPLGLGDAERTIAYLPFENMDGGERHRLAYYARLPSRVLVPQVANCFSVVKPDVLTHMGRPEIPVCT